MLDCFITATDTDAGKTRIAAALLHKFTQNGHSTLGFKPLAAGADEQDGQLQNEDAQCLRRYSSIALEYEAYNPLCFAPAIAPHIAAAQIGKPIDMQQVLNHYQGLQQLKPDVLITEGAGGWLLPLNNEETLAEAMQGHWRDVILVVGMKLGCLNHALLTARCIEDMGFRLRGWVANHVDKDMSMPVENVDTLRQMIPAPCLGVVPYMPELTIEKVAQYLDITPLIRI